MLRKGINRYNLLCLRNIHYEMFSVLSLYFGHVVQHVTGSCFRKDTSLNFFKQVFGIMKKKLRPHPGFEPGTTHTLSGNHTPRPTSLSWLSVLNGLYSSLPTLVFLFSR